MSETSEEKFELPQLYKRHVFACFTQRPPNHPLWERLGKRVEADGGGEIGFTSAGCMGFCSAGPLMVVYPEGVWYRPTTTEDIDEIYDSHLKGGKRVDRLVMILSR